jgi:DNA-binding LacI/PurR family transcriptional regulator
MRRSSKSSSARRKPTINEVAKLAGVAVGTVSNVITGAVPVSEKLREKVQAVISNLDYHPNYVARSLKTSRTRMLGIIVPDLTIPFYPQIIRGVETAAHQRDYSLIAVSSEDDLNRERELLSLLRSQRMEGILLVTAAEPTSHTSILRITEEGIPLVLVDRIPDKVSVDSVSVEDAAAAQMGVEHLIAMGSQRIAIITGPLTLTNERERLRGDKSALRRAGLMPDDGLIWEGNLCRGDVAAMCRERLRDTTARPDAIFSTNGPTGLGVLRALRDCGLHTPEDIGFVTFDELVVEDVFLPSITTIVQPAFEIGFQAADILLKRIEGKSKHYKPVTVRLPATLAVRASSQIIAGTLAPSVHSSQNDVTTKPS